MENKFFNTLTGNNPVILQISASDLKELVKNMYAEEQQRLNDAIAKHREKPTLSRKETAKILGVTLTTLWQWAKEGYLIPVKIGTKVMYKASDVDELLTKYSQTK